MLIFLQDEQLLLRRKILVREGHDFLAFRSRGDTADSDIDLACRDGGEQCREAHVLDFHLDTELVSKLLAHFDIESDDLLVSGARVYEYIWRVAGRGADDDLASLLDGFHQLSLLRFAGGSRFRCTFVIPTASHQKRAGSSQTKQCEFYRFFHLKDLAFPNW